jgi:hypothetical protein
MTTDYPGSLNLGKSVWLPLNLEIAAPWGLGKAKPGTAELQLIVGPAGGTEVSRTVKIRLRPGA